MLLLRAANDPVAPGHALASRSGGPCSVMRRSRWGSLAARNAQAWRKDSTVSLEFKVFPFEMLVDNKASATVPTGSEFTWLFVAAPSDPDNGLPGNGIGVMVLILYSDKEIKSSDSFFFSGVALHRDLRFLGFNEIGFMLPRNWEVYPLFISNRDDCVDKINIILAIL